MSKTPLRLFVDTQYENEWSSNQWNQRAQTWQSSGLITLAPTPNDAETILVILTTTKKPFPETIEALKKSEIYKKRAESLFVYDTSDDPRGFFPGIYTSLRSILYSPSRHRTGGYLGTFNKFLEFIPVDETMRPRYLLSFVGDVTSPLRQRIFENSWPSETCYLKKVSFWNQKNGPNSDEIMRGYARILLESRFILCPRGNGISSFRLFESLEVGRVPVIISDAWVPPVGIDWDKISVRIAEKDWMKTPEILAAYDARWPKMAREARNVWVNWFSPEGMAHLIQTSITSIRKSRTLSERYRRLEWPLREAFISGWGLLARSKGRLLNLKKSLHSL